MGKSEGENSSFPRNKTSDVTDGFNRDIQVKIESNLLKSAKWRRNSLALLHTNRIDMFQANLVFRQN